MLWSNMEGFGADGTWVSGDDSANDYGCTVVRRIDGTNRWFDACLLWELERLWAQGIDTECCCCGHGRHEPKIGVSDDESAAKMRALGYVETEPLYEGCSKNCVPMWFRAKSQLTCEKGQPFNLDDKGATYGI